MDFQENVIDLYVAASMEFERRLKGVREWTAATPCSEWDVRRLVNHMVRGNVNYVALLNGAEAAEFLRLREADALGDDPVGAYGTSVREFVEAFGRPEAWQRRLDYPLGKVKAGQAVAVRMTDTVIHTWDLARATHTDDTLRPELVEWIEENAAAIYEGLEGMQRFFGSSTRAGESKQDRLLRRMGR
ncbi:TIGR03086 family metal-binding protein [Kutzneria sp. NPDC051319]|uniref:TIGR03086 family metal-binding protein n=1 Tax=Kutzneria sp. NPDC051319 TaxID=3155047 RepID=UPI0034159396